MRQVRSDSEHASLLAAGASFTAADVLLTSVLVGAQQCGWLPSKDLSPEEHAAIDEYVARNTARPAYRRAAALP